MSPRPRPRLIVTMPVVADLTPDPSHDEEALLEWLLSRDVTINDPSIVAAGLLVRFETLAGVLSADASELCRVPGVDPRTAADLKLIRRLLERASRAEASRRPVIGSWSALLNYVRLALAEEPREQFRALFLDKRNRLLRDELVAHGTIDHAPVYPREVVRRALEVSAAAIILVHNHPSGDPEPSRADIEMTRKVVEAAKLFEIQVHDHLVVARDGTASLRALGHFR